MIDSSEIRFFPKTLILPNFLRILISIQKKVFLKEQQQQQSIEIDRLLDVCKQNRNSKHSHRPFLLYYLSFVEHTARVIRF